MNMSAFMQWFQEHRWIPFAALVIGFLVRMTKEDTKGPVLNKRVRFWLVIGLAFASAVIERLALNVGWEKAIYEGLVAGLAAMVGHEAIVGSLRNGKEFAIPGLMKDESKNEPPKIPILPFLLILTAAPLVSCTKQQSALLVDLLADKTKCAIVNMDLPNDEIAKRCLLDPQDLLRIIPLLGEARAQASQKSTEAYARGRKDESQFVAKPLCPEPKK